MSLSLSCLPVAYAAAVSAQDHHGQRPSRARMSSSAPTEPSDDRQRADALLLRRMADGDRSAFAELYDRFSRPLYSTALRIVSDAAEAQDIVHDAFVALWEKASVFQSERGTAFGWAVTLVRHRAIDRLRTRRRRAELLAAAPPADLGYEDTASGATLDDPAALGDEARVVRDAIASLPTEQRRALELAFFGGLTQQQIAEKLSEPLGTVKARVRRGLLKLRDTLARRL